MSTYTLPPLAAVLLACLAPPGTGHAVPVPPGTVAGFADIPLDLRHNQSFSYVRTGFQKGRVSIDAANREVLIDWISSALVNSNQPPDPSLPIDILNNTVGNAKGTLEIQVIPTRFWPTTACVADGSDIVVAGYTSDGHTVIESWSLEWPPLMPGVQLDTTTGLSSVPIVVPTVGSKHRLYDDLAVGRKVVRNLSPIRISGQDSTHLLAQFNDSREVYAVRRSDGQLLLLASPTSSATPLGQIATLAGGNLNVLGCRAWPDYGYIYTFSSRPGHVVDASSLGTGKTPVLIDVDRDGSIDEAHELSLGDFEALGWDTLDSYEDWWRP